MKKYIIPMAVLMLCPASAYGSSYSSDDGSPFLFIILLIGSILSIVLFFKIWGMTNNITHITNLLAQSRPIPKFKEGETVYCIPRGCNMKIVKDLGDDTYLCHNQEYNQDMRYHARALFSSSLYEELPYEDNPSEDETQENK